MKKLTILCFIIILKFSVYGQRDNSLNNFKVDFVKAVDIKFTDEQLSAMFREYNEILTPHSEMTQFEGRLRGHNISIYPLFEFKGEKLYLDNIDMLLNSQNSNHRILAYLVIASSGDSSKESVLLSKIVTEKAKGNLFWAGMALLYLKTNRITELFDFLVKNEDFGDPHMLQKFILLNKDSLQQTAYNRINDKNEKSKILAAQVLSITPLNSESELLLKQAIQNWDIELKGYAIYSVKELQIGNLLEIIKPYLDNKAIQGIAYEALANSPTKADNEYLYNLVDEQDTISTELLDCFYKSKRIDNLKFWLEILSTRKVPFDYKIFVFEQPLLSSDNVLSNLQNALQKIKNKFILSELVRALTNRDDDKSVEIIKVLLNDKSSTVRYWTAKTVEDNHSQKFNTTEFKKLIKEGLVEGASSDE